VNSAPSGTLFPGAVADLGLDAAEARNSLETARLNGSAMTIKESLPMNATALRLPASTAVRTAPTHVVWDLTTFASGNRVYDRLLENEPAIAAVMEGLREEVPIARTCASFAEEPYSRPFEHRRCFYYSFDSGGTLAFKGTEPLADDFADEVRHIESTRSPFSRSALNHFVTAEHKVSLGVSVHEAQTQADITTRFQADHVARFGTLARVPVPLLVVQWPPSVREGLLETLRPYLAPTSFANLVRITEPGLGALVYYYPTLPLRASAAAPGIVADLLYPEAAYPERMGASVAQRLDRLRERVEPSDTVTSWIQLVADMLLLGYFPFDTYYMGHCLQLQNLCIDGGCVDTDSLVPMSRIGEERYFNELFVQNTLALAQSISSYLRGTGSENQANQVIVASVWEELHRRLRDRVTRGESCDPRLERLLNTGGYFARLERLLGSILLGAVPERGDIWT
jgi:hypothetical protein